MRDWAKVAIAVVVAGLVALLITACYCANRGNMVKEQREERVCVQYGNQWVAHNCIYKGAR